MTLFVLPNSEPALNRLQSVIVEQVSPKLKQNAPPKTPTPHASWTSKGDGCFLVQGMEAGVCQLSLIKLTELPRQPRSWL